MISRLINELYNLDFTSNTFADKGHEGSVKKILMDSGFIEASKSDASLSPLKNRDNVLKTIPDLATKCIFIEQPFGSQRSPDFIVCVNGLVLWIECKSGKDTILWNTGYPKNDIMVVFSSKNKRTTTLFFGQFTELLVKNPDFEDIYNRIDAEAKQFLAKQFKDRIDSDNCDLYCRRMLNDKTKYSDPELRLDFFTKTKGLLGIEG